MVGAPEINVEEIMAQIREGIARRQARGEFRESVTSRSQTDLPHAAPPSQNQPMPEMATLQTAFDIRNVQLTSHRGALGPVILCVKRILHQLLTPILSRQVEYNAAGATVLASLCEQVSALRWDLAQIHDQVIRSRTQELQAIHDRLDALGRNQAWLPGLRTLEEGLGELRGRVGMLGVEQQGARERIARAERKLRRIVHDLAGDQTLERRQDSAEAAALPELPEEFDYVGFEERYRGSEEEIKERFRVYVDRFKGATAVLDIGCGRGEFLELLRDSRISARGVDLALDMVLLCREKGLDVVRADALPYLASLADESLDGVFAAQVIEHLEATQIVRLVQLAHRKLRANGILILETPNPRCLTVFAEAFYMDLSHTRPIHPGAAKFLLESTGFGNVELKFSVPVEPSAKIPALPPAAFPSGAVDEFNRGLERLNELLYGCQDYAVIGEKIPVLS
jgi:SAM-dependent methyltransferase